MYQQTPVVTSSLVFTFTGLFVLLYPPSLLRLRQAYVGGPIGDKDLDLRLEASEMFQYVETDDDAWESTSEGCGFRYNYNTDTGVVGNEVSLGYAYLCIQQKGLDLYAVQGVEISTPFEDPAEANDTAHWVYDSFSWYWYRFTDYDLLRHTIYLGTIDLETLGVSGYDLNTWEVEGLLDIVDIRGPHALANMYKVCTASSSAGFSCSVSFDFWGETEVVEPSDGSAGKRLAADKLDSLVQNGDVLEGESESAANEICDSFDGEVTGCDIECDIHYPYSSSLCTGSVESREIGELPHSTSIAALSLVLLLATLVVAFTRRYFGCGEWRSWRPHAQENPINSTPPFIMPTSNNPSGGAYAVGHDGPTRQRAVVESMDKGRVIPLESWPGCEALLIRASIGGRFRISGDSVVLACCILEHGMIRNAKETEVGEMLEPEQSREFTAASRNGNTLEWASAFSIYHCISCVWMYGVLTHVAVSSGWGAFYWLLALFTYGFFSEETCLGTVVRACRFRGRILPYSARSEGILLPSLLGAAQLWYELGLPNGWILSWGIFMLVAVIVTANVTLVCLVYGKLPTADRAHSVTRTSWSVEDAMELCRASGSPFGMAGDWIERSRCGDIAGRTAFMTSLGRVEPNRGSRVGHVYKRSQMSWAAHGRGGQPIETYGGIPGGNEGLCLEEEQMMLSYSGELVMVCAERSSEPKESRH